MGKGQFRGALRVLVAMALMLALSAPALAASYVVIAHKDVPVNALSKSDLQAIFLGEKVKWDGIHYVKIAVPEDPELLRSFLQNVIGKTPSQFDNHWAKLVYSGRATMPPSFADQSKLVEFVSKRNGAISFVTAGQAIGAAKVIAIK